MPNAKILSEKQAIVASLTEKFQNAAAGVIVDYKGITVAEDTALRVELGEGKGHNWFCVLYPALCVSGAQAAYPTREENALVFGRYEIRLAVVDAVKNFMK